MSAAPAAAKAFYRVTIDRVDDFEGWRDKARSLAAARIPPEQILWSLAAQGAPDLFGAADAGASVLPSARRLVHANKAFLALAERVVLHRDPERFALLYRLLWRLQDDRALMAKPADRDIHRLSIMAGHVRRDIHKMRAFVRFRMIEEADGQPRYIAWFEPDHHIMRANADFFLNRFASQRWSILTPDLCLHWDGEALTETPGADRHAAPGEDAVEQLWQGYYAAIFNPARLKVAAMVKEMPRRYWKNMPEARLISDLIAGAQAREAAMVADGGALFPDAAPVSLGEIAHGISACRRCPIGCLGTRAVAGEGPQHARLLIVGEQPGDHEERDGRPFVGPAGVVLDAHLLRAGFDRARIRLTNAVKHFKFEQRGKRRIHHTPTAGEIDRCRWWLDAERRLVGPDHILALGASAGRAILGRTPNIARERGRPIALPDGSHLWLTVHPSYLLRVDAALTSGEEGRFHADLVAVRAALAA